MPFKCHALCYLICGERISMQLLQIRGISFQLFYHAEICCLMSVFNYSQEHLFIVCELLRANLYEFQKFNRESGGEPYFTMSRLQVCQLCNALLRVNYPSVLPKEFHFHRAHIFYIQNNFSYYNSRQQEVLLKIYSMTMRL